MSADHLHRFIVNLTDHDPPAWRDWYGRQVLVAQGLLHHTSLSRGNPRFGSQDALDVVHDALVLVCEDCEEEVEPEIKPIVPMSTSEAVAALVPFLRRAINKLHDKTRVSRAAKPPAPGELGGADPRSTVGPEQIEAVYRAQLIENARAQAIRLLKQTRLNSEKGVGRYLLLHGGFVGQACDVKDMAGQLGTSEANIHQYRARAAEIIGRLLDAPHNGSTKDKPPSDE